MRVSCTLDADNHTGKYVLNFKEPAKAINRILLVTNGLIMATQSPR